MPNNFIPSLHLIPAQDKLKPEFCKAVIDYYWHNTNNKSLLWNKRVDEIEGYSTGNYSMKEFKMMFKSYKKKFAGEHPDLVKNGTDITEDDMNFISSPLIPSKLNAAIATVQKVPVEVKCEALDPLAERKKLEDITFLKNKPKLEEDMQDLADQLQIGKVDLGATKNSDRPFSDSPYGFNLNNPEELDVFINLLYNLGVETCFETALQIFYEIKNGQQHKLLQIIDQFKYGVSCCRAFESSITGLPDEEYMYPGSIRVPKSNLPDFSDRTHWFWEERKTAMEVFNYFSEEICNEEIMNEILNDKVFGYCACNNLKSVDRTNWDGFKIDLVYCEVRSVDSVGIMEKKNSKKGYTYFTNDAEEIKECKNKVWAQNTYSFWWLRNTKYFFKIEKLGFAHRTKGLETYQNFTGIFYKSQERSAVELSIGENKKAQIADIKLMYAVIMSLPAGRYINLKYLRGALEGLTDENDKYTLDSLINLALEKNLILGDTEGFDGKNDGQLKPFEDIPGGLKSEINGYMQIKAEAKQNISQYTGINDSLTGFSQNADTLVGLEKLKISASLNALYYVNEAIQSQEQKKFNIWAGIIKTAVEKGGAPKEAIRNLIGSRKVNLIDAMDEIALHDIGVKITINQREEERQKFELELNRLKQLTIIDTADEFLLMYIPNIKERYALLSIRFKQWRERQDRERQQQFTQQQQLMQQQGQNLVQGKQAEAEGEKELAYVKGEINSKILTLANQFGISDKQLDAIVKKNLQQDRAASQLNKSIETLRAKADMQNQSALPVT